MTRALLSIFLIVLFLALAGCGSTSSSSSYATTALNEPVVDQLVRASPPLKSQRFSTLLDFESDADGVFIASRPAGRLVYDRAHTGARSMRVSNGTPRFSVKLTSLLSGRPFPGDWTLIGGFIYCQKPITVKVAVESAGFAVQSRMVSVAADTWTLALIDISSTVETARDPAERDARPLPENARVTFTLPPNSPPVWFDDALLIDNTQTLVSQTPPTAQAPNAATPSAPPSSTAPADAPVESQWSVARKGLSFVGDSPGHFSFKLLTTEATPDGWTLAEANDLRARFTSDGPKKSITVYADGRSFWDGEYKPLSAESRSAAYVEQHASPADVSVPQELGHVTRNTPGDANNDGYNEQRGAYQLAATEARLEVRITPHTNALVRPVLEITGLPPGKVLVTIEGRLVEKQTRLDDGTLLVELPARIDRPTTINLRIQ